MSGPENTFIASVHRHLPAKLYRMKNHNQYNGGIADVWYSGKRDWWIEYKFVKVPIRDSTLIDLVGGKKPELSHLQQEWLTQRHIEGRNVGVLVGCKEGGVWMPGITWDRTFTSYDFRTKIIDRRALADMITKMCNEQKPPI